MQHSLLCIFNKTLFNLLLMTKSQQWKLNETIPVVAGALY